MRLNQVSIFMKRFLDVLAGIWGDPLVSQKVRSWIDSVVWFLGHKSFFIHILIEWAAEYYSLHS